MLEEHPLRDLVTTEGRYPFFVDRERALFGSWYEFFPRSEGAYVDRATAPGGLRHLPHRRRSGSTRSPRWASTWSTCRRSTRSARSTARAPTTPSTPARTTSGRRGRSAPTRAATTRSTPTSAPSRTSTRSWRAPASSAWRSPSTSRCRRPRTTRGSPAHPEWFTTRADGTIAYAENPPKKYQDIYPINFDNDPEGIYAEVLRIVRHWMSHGVRIFRVDNPHTKPVQFWEWLLGRGPPDRPGRALPRRGVHPAADDARAGRRSASTSPTPTSPGATPSGSSSSTSPSCRASPARTCGPTSS